MYHDDILITEITTEKHIENVDGVLCRLEDAGLHLNPDQCTFMQPCIEYMGRAMKRVSSN